MGGLVCGLDVHRGWCEAAVIYWFGNVVDSRRVSKDELLPFLSRMNVSLVAMESSGYVYPMYSCCLMTNPDYAVLVPSGRRGLL